MGTLGNVLVRGFLFFSSTYQNICYRRCSTKKYFWWKNRIPFENLHHVILGVPPKFQIVGGRVFLCRRFLGVFDESVLQGSTLTGWSISWLDWILLRQLVAWCHCNLAYGEKKQHTPCRNCTAEIAAPWPCDPRVSTAGEANLAHYIFHWLWLRITCEASLSVHFLPK